MERTNAFVLWCVLLGKEGGKWPQPLGSGPGREAGGFLSRSLAPDVGNGPSACCLKETHRQARAMLGVWVLCMRGVAV